MKRVICLSLSFIVLLLTSFTVAHPMEREALTPELEQKIQLLFELEETGISISQALGSLQDQGFEINDVLQYLRANGYQDEVDSFYSSAGTVDFEESDGENEEDLTLQEKLAIMQELMVKMQITPQQALTLMLQNGISVQDVIQWIKQQTSVATPTINPAKLQKQLKILQLLIQKRNITPDQALQYMVQKGIDTRMLAAYLYKMATGAAEYY